jgi:hypothetical protein
MRVWRTLNAGYASFHPSIQPHRQRTARTDIEGAGVTRHKGAPLILMLPGGSLWRTARPDRGADRSKSKASSPAACRTHASVPTRARYRRAPSGRHLLLNPGIKAQKREIKAAADHNSKLWEPC